MSFGLPTTDSTPSAESNTLDQTDYSLDHEPTLEEVAVVLTFRQTIDKFYYEQPSKMKWSPLTESDVRRFVYYNIVEPAPVNMGEQTVWQLCDWVETILTISDVTYNFSAKQIRDITRYSDSLARLDDEFTAKQTKLAGRSVGHLHKIDVISIEEDNRNKHRPTVWKVSDKVQKIIDLHEKLARM